MGSISVGGAGGSLWTKDQELAITLSGKNILVSAAAGAGKTSVLVERVIRQVLSPNKPLDLERLLVVTFTEKAAAEMKQRVRASLEAAVRESRGDSRMKSQLALLDRSQISTIHAFCLRILRKYFYKVDLDPSFRVLDANEAELLRLDAVTELFEDLYDDETPYGEVFRAVVERFGGRGIDEGLQIALLRLHDFARAQPSAEGFLEAAKTQAGGTDMAWLKCLVDRALSDVERATALAKEAEAACLKPGGPEGYLEAILSDMSLYTEAEGMLKALQFATGVGDADVVAAAAASRIASMSHTRLGRVKECDPDLQDEVKALRDLSKKAFARVADYVFMRPLGEVRKELSEIAPLIAGLCDMASDLDDRYTAKKRDRGGVDFSDLERYCLEILEKDGGRLAAGVRGEFDCILVDEYQDTNPLQERILTLVSCQDAGSGNVFMVGDLKQSIYRFRLAEPRLFLEKFRSYEPAGTDAGSATTGAYAGTGTAGTDAGSATTGAYAGTGRAGVDSGCESVPGLRVDLSHNFRSRAEVIDAINVVFGNIMQEGVADIDYSKGHALRAGATYPPGEGRFAAEIHLVERLGISSSGIGGDEAETVASSGEDASRPDEVEEYESLEKEALVVASRIREMVESDHPLMLWDAKSKTSRPCSYRDIAILMRSTKDRANAVIEVLSRCDIPSYADTGSGYFQAREIEVAMALLAIIDNPMQDIPLAAVLRSAIVGIEPKDLAVIRSYRKNGSFYEAVRALAREQRAEVASGEVPRAGAGLFGTEQGPAGNASPEILSAASLVRVVLQGFLENLERWRTMARRRPLAEVLWSILTETGYHDYVGGLPGGAQRQANLRALCDRAREFDSFGRHGLFRFLRFIERLQESQGDLGTARALGEHEDVVRLLSIHKAKGLEFPVVFVMDLGKKFNTDDVRQDILLHRDLGVGAVYFDPDTRVKYPTALHQAIAAKIRQENLAEEMRVLYVALTRAKEKLCIVGSARDLEKQMWRWRRPDAAAALTCLDWICPVALTFAGERPQSAESPAPAAEPASASTSAASTSAPASASTSASASASASTSASASASAPPSGPFIVKIWGTAGGNPIPIPPERTLSDAELKWNDVRNLLPPPSSDPAIYDEVKRRLEWRYPLSVYTTTQAKMSVGELKRRLEGDDEANWRFLPRPTRRLGMEQSKGYSSAVERGIAVHALLSRAKLDRVHSAEAIASECARLLEAGFIQEPGVDADDIARVAAFFGSPAGVAMRECTGQVLREVPFTMKVSASVFGVVDSRAACSGGEAGNSSGAEDIVVVQGVIDVLLDEPDGLTIFDYKTDDVIARDISPRVIAYTPQVALYALAASRILGKPVKKASIIFLGLSREVEVDWQAYLGARGIET